MNTKKHLLCLMLIFFIINRVAGQALILNVNDSWQLQEISKVSQTGAILSLPGYTPSHWYSATVPGTVLTTLVNNHVYPEPLYGENNRPDKIPESLNKTAYWYHTEVLIPKNYSGKTISLNFEGINYAAEVWVNGKMAGTIKGAFTRGIFDITPLVQAGQKTGLAVLVYPQPNPGNPHEHTIKLGMGLNGGITASDGPTFLCAIGWDWIPAIRDRNTGIWQKVFINATNAAQIKDPLITSEVALPGLQSADIAIRTTVNNTSGQICKGILKGAFGSTTFEKEIEIPAHGSQLVEFAPQSYPQLRLQQPKLWWPNGYGAQNLYPVKLAFEINGKVSDVKEMMFGIRKITYSVADAENLTISVNGVRILCKGGNWGMDEAMKRIPRERLEAQIRMHQIANYTMIRNWVGQSTSEDFYQLCDKYGILLWDEFFQPNPSDGPNPTDLNLYIANVREKILRYRNHPSIAVWCARNEGYPPKNIDSALQKLMTELEPVRLYQPSSTAGRGVNSGGPYRWRVPADYYTFGEAFKTEIGSMSIPTLESIHGMMPKKDWEVINDDWAEHDFARGAQQGENYRKMIDDRYGPVANLADFVRKGQLANYEAYRAMYEGRNAKLFDPVTGVITWMSNPAQPSFVWQLYHHDLEPNASLFAAKKGCEPLHVQLNEKEGTIQVINNLGTALMNANVLLSIYNLNGDKIYQKKYTVNAIASRATQVSSINWPQLLTAVHFIKLQLTDADGKAISNNFYWRAQPDNSNNLQDLNKLPVTKLAITATSENKNGQTYLNVTIHNPTRHIALMTHLQLRRQKTQMRVLPVYYSDNYVSLLPGETKIITIEASKAAFKGELPLLAVDGWNVDAVPSALNGIVVKANKDAWTSSWPVTGLPIINQASANK